jgi:hypothetical protein
MANPTALSSARISLTFCSLGSRFKASPYVSRAVFVRGSLPSLRMYFVGDASAALVCDSLRALFFGGLVGISKAVQTRAAI